MGYDYDSEDCARTVSISNKTLNIEPWGQSRGVGHYNSVAPALTSERADHIDVSPEIAPVPFIAECTPVSSSEGGMLLTHDQSAERGRLVNDPQQSKQKQASMTGPDPQGQPNMIEEREYLASISFGDVPIGLHRLTATIRWFLRATVIADVEYSFESLARCTWDGEFLASIPVAAFSWRVLADLIAVDEVYLSYRCSFAVKRL